MIWHTRCIHRYIYRIQMKLDEDKMRVVGSHLAFTYTGEPGDTANFSDYLQANFKLSVYRNNTQVSPPAAANWIRNELAKSIRSRSPKAVNLLLGGYDTATQKPHLYWLVRRCFCFPSAAAYADSLDSPGHVWHVGRTGICSTRLRRILLLVDDGQVPQSSRNLARRFRDAQAMYL